MMPTREEESEEVKGTRFLCTDLALDRIIEQNKAKYDVFLKKIDVEIVKMTGVLNRLETKKQGLI